MKIPSPEFYALIRRQSLKKCKEAFDLYDNNVSGSTTDGMFREAHGKTLEQGVEGVIACLKASGDKPLNQQEMLVMAAAFEYVKRIT